MNQKFSLLITTVCNSIETQNGEHFKYIFLSLGFVVQKRASVGSRKVKNVLYRRITIVSAGMSRL